MANKSLKDNLKELGVSWESAPVFEKITKMQTRIIVGPNGCGKSRLLRALRETLFANGVKKTNVLYADFPQIASTERRGTDKAELQLLNDIFVDRRDTPIYETLKLISSDPIKGINCLVALSKNDSRCKSTVDKINTLLELLFADLFDIGNITDVLLGEKELSPGQRSLLYMSIMLGVLTEYHSNDAFYILLDEPDQHLHAKSIVDFICRLQESIPKAKLWIATHSVHLMAHYKFDEIIFILDNKVQTNNSMIYDDICEEMVDTKEMQQFVSFSGLYGFYEFFRECLSEAEAESDPNNKLNEIKKRIQQRGIKKILDYGAGKGRFFRLLSDITCLNYHAFEVAEKYHKDLQQLLPSERIHTTIADIPKDFDAVLLINTLHEIPLDEWPRTFAAIKKSLKKDGVLLFCETSPLITGEHIINPGFLVLGIKEQQVLFGVESSTLNDNKKLHFSEVPRDNIPILDRQKFNDVLTALENNSFEQWEKEKSNARNMAFYAMQHMNAERAVKELPKLFKRAAKLLKLDKNMESKPDNAIYYCNRGDKFCKYGKFELALKEYTKAIELSPDEADYYDKRGEVHYLLDDLELALEDESEAIKLDKNNDFYYYQRGLYYRTLNKYELALQDIDKTVELKPDEAIYYLTRGSIHARLKNYELAINDYDKAIKLNSNNANAYKNRAEAYLALGENAKAAADFYFAVGLETEGAANFNKYSTFAYHIDQFILDASGQTAGKLRDQNGNLLFGKPRHIAQILPQQTDEHINSGSK